MSRQDPDYPLHSTARDAMAVVTALHADPRLEGIGEDALRFALDGTDHTGLAYQLGLIVNMLASNLAAMTGETHEQVLQRVGAALAAAIEADEDEPS